MRNVEAHLLEDKMDEAVTHYINSHQSGEHVHLDTNGLALNVQDESGGRVTVMHQTYSTPMCRQVSVGEQVGEGPWSEELLDPEGRIAAIVAHLAQHSRGSHHHQTHHKMPSVRDVDTSVILDGSIRFNGQALDHQTESIVVHLPSMPTLPPLQEMKRCQDTDWFHNKNKPVLKSNAPMMSDSDSPVLELNAGASPAQNKQQNRKSLPHKKRISRKLRKNNGNSTPQQDLVVINCTEEPPEMPQEEILPDNFVTGVQHPGHMEEDSHHMTHEVRPIFICQICGEFYGDEQLKFYQHLKQHYEPHATIIIENPVSDLGIDKMTNTCIVDNAATLPESIVELSLENTVPKTIYQPMDKHILYTSSDKTLNYTSNKVQYSMASMDKEPSLPSEVDKTDLYESFDKLDFYTCGKCNKSFRKQKQCEAHMREAHQSEAHTREPSSISKLEDMGEFSEPEDLMEGIHVSVGDTEQYEQTLLPHLTVENGHVHQDHVRHWYMRVGGVLPPCAPDDAYCPVCPAVSGASGTPASDAAPDAPHPSHPPPPPPDPRDQPPEHHNLKVLKEEVLQRIFEEDLARQEAEFAESAPPAEGEAGAGAVGMVAGAGGPRAEDSKCDSEVEDKKKTAKLECRQCSRVFHHRNSLLYHALSHAGRQHVCRDCGKSFYTIGALKIHKRVHNGDRPYKCDVCGREFRQWSDLKYHKISLHTDQKRFKCEFCDKAFARKYSLSVHRRIHTGEKNYKCEFCNMTFRASSYRLSHMRTHTGDKPYKCEMCEKCFRVAGDLRRHMLTHDKLRTKPDKSKTKEPKDKKANKTLENKEPPKPQNTSPKSVKKPAIVPTPRPPVVKKQPPKATKKNPNKKGAPNVIILNQNEIVDMQLNTEYTNNVEVFDTRQVEYSKYKEVYHEQDNINSQIVGYKSENSDDRDLAILKPMFRSVGSDSVDNVRPVYSKTENTDGKMQVFTHVEKNKVYNGSIVANSQVSLGDIRHLEREVAREVRSDINGEVIENGFFERLTAMYNISAV